MRVIATALGYYNGRRIKIGDRFDYSQVFMKRVKVDAQGRPVFDTRGAMIVDWENGQAILPSWVAEDTEENRKAFEQGILLERERAKAAAFAANGPKRSRRGFAVAEGSEEVVGVEDLVAAKRAKTAAPPPVVERKVYRPEDLV